MATQMAYHAANAPGGIDLKNVELALWSIMSHVVLSIIAVSALNILFMLAARTAFPRLVRIGIIAAAISFGLGSGVASFLNTAFNLSGPPSIFYSALLATALVSQLCAFILHWRVHKGISGSPVTERKNHKLPWISVLAGLAALTLLLPLFIGEWDWNSIVQRLNTLLLWIVLPFCFCRLLQRPRYYSVPALLAAVIIAGCSYKALQWTEFAWARPLGLIDQDVAASMELYAADDISFQLAR
jgi:hypothetical protein